MYILLHLTVIYILTDITIIFLFIIYCYYCLFIRVFLMIVFESNSCDNGREAGGRGETGTTRRNEKQAKKDQIRPDNQEKAKR